MVSSVVNVLLGFFKMAKNKRMVNGYVTVFKPDHPKAMKGESWGGYIYEHILVAEEMIDRQLKEGEVVHHLDSNRSNNSPDNLLTLSGPMHAKLHSWLDKHTIIPNEKQVERINKGCIRCLICSKPISADFIYCSPQCSTISQRKDFMPDKETLSKEVLGTPLCKLGEKYNVSDNTVRRWCKDYGIETKRGAGRWPKKEMT